MIEKLTKWYQKNKRALPWRIQKTAYAIWISEIMCQQTRIDTVIPYYERFMATLPTIETLANVEDDILLKLWQGLGYYNRAKNLKKSAQIIVAEYGGVFPKDYEQAIRLPGIGSYTAGAVLSMAYQLPYAAIDGNALRVFSRFYKDNQDIALPQTKDYWKKFVESQSILDFGEFNQAVMDLGATICLPNDAPKCMNCPLAEECLAHKEHVELLYPVKTKSREKKTEEWTVFLIELDGKILLHKRSSLGLLADLYEFVNAPGALSKSEVIRLYSDALIRVEDGPTLTHIFTHKKWIMHSYFLKLSYYDLKEDENFYSLAEIERNLSIPQAFLQFLNYFKLKS